MEFLIDMYASWNAMVRGYGEQPLEPARESITPRMAGSDT